jgi:hypothetical protein
MKLLIVSLMAAYLIALGEFHPVQADDTTENPPNASFGVAGSFNAFSAWERKKGDQYTGYNLAPGYGGGVIYEKMYNNLLGIHSGLWFNRLSLNIRMKQPLDPFAYNFPLNLLPMKLTVHGWSVSVPLSLIVSFNTSIFSFNILGGIKYTHIVESLGRPDNRVLSYKRNLDIMPYINQPQFGFTIGFNLKFRIATFIDLFLGCMGNLYVTALIKGRNDTSLLYDINAVSGVMFRTNIFPMID